jgi:hypothetical protein
VYNKRCLLFLKYLHICLALFRSRGLNRVL